MKPTRLHYASNNIRQTVIDGTSKELQKDWKLGTDEQGPYIEVPEDCEWGRICVRKPLSLVDDPSGEKKP